MSITRLFPHLGRVEKEAGEGEAEEGDEEDDGDADHLETGLQEGV